MPTERHILRAAQALGMGANVQDVRAMLVREGLNEYQAFLCIKAAELYNQPF